MDYNEYLDIKDSIDAYVKTGNQRMLAEIQANIEKKNGLREKLIEDLEYHEEYIQVFSTDEQIKIVGDLVSQIKQRKYSSHKVSWMLPYVSDKALNEILAKADNVALVKIMDDIKRNIRVIGNRFCDSSAYFWLKSTNIFSRMGERITWSVLYRKCKKNLKK